MCFINRILYQFSGLRGEYGSDGITLGFDSLYKKIGSKREFHVLIAYEFYVYDNTLVHIRSTGTKDKSPVKTFKSDAYIRVQNYSQSPT
jgi:hypothetical protein